MSENRFQNWLNLVAKNENFIKYSVKVLGETGKGDGYMSKITFVAITGSTRTKEKKVLNLIVKMSSTNQLLRKQISLKQFFENEINIYDQIAPAFRKLEQELGIKSNPINFLPVCYHTHISEDQEVVVLENLKTWGFDVWDRRIPMTDEHFRLILQAFAKWNAFSLALKQKQPAFFDKITKRKTAMFAYFIMNCQLDGVFLKFFEDVRDFWKNDPEVTQVAFTIDDIRYIYSDLVMKDSDYHVILHGDSWTNNFMFKLEEKSKKPVDLRIIDWQCTGLASPVMDLSVFIYCCVDTATHQNVQTILKTYYDILSETLIQLGCKPSEVFPYRKLLEHWKRFSKYGLLLGTFLLKFCLAESDEVPDFVETASQGKEFLENFQFSIAKKEAYFERIKNNILHYVRNLK